MIKRSEVDFSTDYLRLDTTWQFEWTIDDEGAQTFNPVINGSDDASITLANSTENVIIDNIPPSFVSDRGTDYTTIASAGNAVRHCEYIFRDEAGLDYKQFSICIGEKVVYKYVRKDESAQPIIDENYIAKNSLKISSDGYNTYKVEFDLYCKNTINDELNEHGLTIEVWDKAANKSAYTFGPNESEEFKKEWIIIDSPDGIGNLDSCVIKFYDAEPANMIVDEAKTGSVWVSIYNPNQDLWSLDITGQLNIQTSVGAIDNSTISYEYQGTKKRKSVLKFKVVNINKSGSVDIQAWVSSGVKTLDDFIIPSTYAEASLGQWIVKDAEGRLYNIQKFVPNYLKSTDYHKFIEFFELYLNTLYTNITKGTNISALEKIAKIGDFNDIDRMEHHLIREYAKQLGSEFDIDLETLKGIEAGFFNDDVLDKKSDEDIIDIIKYALKNLPFYNQVKGTNQGIIMALGMFSFTCKIINLWVKKEEPIEDNPVFIEESEIIDYNSYFMTSRFNLKVNGMALDYSSFNKNIYPFIKLIKSVKPIIRVLNLIKYTLSFNNQTGFVINDNLREEGGNDKARLFNLTWQYQKLNDTKKYSTANVSQHQAKRIWISYSASNNTPLYPIYTALSSYMNTYGKLKIQFGLSTAMQFIEIDLNDVTVEMLDTGFYIYPKSGKTATLMMKLIDALNEENMDDFRIQISFYHIIGTEVFYTDE